MKLEPRLPQLPSLGELLEHPRVKGLVARVNQSTLAKRAGGFLEEMRASLVDRAGRVEMPSLTHLAERLARRLLGEPAAEGPVINATGLVLGDRALAPPLAESALHAMVQLAGEYHRCDAAQRETTEQGLSELVGAEAACLTSSFETAVTLAVAATAGNREAAVYGDARAAEPIDWRWIAARAGAVPRFVGSGAARADDVAGAAAIVRTPEADDVEAGVDLGALAAIASARSACLIDVAPIAGVMSSHDYGYQVVAPISARLAAGADLVVADGAGLLGGPSCGIVVGRRGAVEQLARHPLASLLAADPLGIAALDDMLRVYREDAAAAAIYQLPVWQLLSAPIANLQQRSQRLAQLMGESAAVDVATSCEVVTPWRRWGSREWTAKSFAVELIPAGGDAAALAERLARGPYPVIGRQAGGAVQLDLRAVFPRWDEQLVAAVDAAGRE
jgi:L-seryl-tRNA(Ser) seleniumtransferase